MYLTIFLEFITSAATTFANNTLEKTPTGVCCHSVRSALQTYYLNDILKTLTWFGFNPCIPFTSYNKIELKYDNIKEYFKGTAQLNASEKDFNAMSKKANTFFHRTLVLYTQYIKLKEIETENRNYIQDTFSYKKTTFPEIDNIDLPHPFYTFMETIVNYKHNSNTHVNTLTFLNNLPVFDEAKIEHTKKQVHHLSDDYEDLISKLTNNDDEHKRMTIKDTQQHDILLTLFSLAIHNIHPDIFHKEGTSQQTPTVPKLTKNQVLNLFKRVLTCNKKHNPRILSSMENE